VGTTKIQGELEIDHSRGVVYFHTTDSKQLAVYGTTTVLRICSLPKPIPQGTALDITHMFGTNWSKSC